MNSVTTSAPLAPPRSHPATGPAAPYERQAVGLMAFGFALVNLDRFLLYPLFPVMMPELHLDYGDLGLLSGAVALTWGLSSIITGRLADRLGRRRILVVAVVVFSLLCGGTGLAAGMGSLLFCRAVMGIFEGGFTAISVAVLIDASSPHRVGRNLGLQQLMAPFIGIGLTPILATQLLGILPSWHWIFLLAAVPGLACAWLVARVIREPAYVLPAAAESAPALRPTFPRSAMSLNVLCFVFSLGPLILLSALMPSYLADYLHLRVGAMGLVLSGIGLGGGVGALVLPRIADRIGGKPMMLGCNAAVIPLLALLMVTGGHPLALFLLLFAIAGLLTGILTTVHVVTSELVPAPLVATATGLVVGLGEIVGGGLAPAITGTLAKTHGIEITLPITLGLAVAGLVTSALLRPRQPREVAQNGDEPRGI